MLLGYREKSKEEDLYRQGGERAGDRSAKKRQNGSLAGAGKTGQRKMNGVGLERTVGCSARNRGKMGGYVGH